MKKLLVILFMFMPLVSMAQNFNEDGGKYEVYCEVRHEGFGNVSHIVINNKEYIIVDKEGKQIRTKEATEVLNLLAKRGWKLISTYSTDIVAVSRHYVMKREIMNDKEIENGLKEK